MAELTLLNKFESLGYGLLLRHLCSRMTGHCLLESLAQVTPLAAVKHRHSLAKLALADQMLEQALASVGFWIVQHQHSAKLWADTDVYSAVTSAAVAAAVAVKVPSVHAATLPEPPQPATHVSVLLLLVHPARCCTLTCAAAPRLLCTGPRCLN